MARATVAGWVTLSVSAVALAASARWVGRKRPWLMAIAGATFLIHPGFWVSAYGGDCGEARSFGSAVFVTLHLAVAMLARSGRS